ncbi:hypothetical protein [Qipengyuania sp. ASV99]|uniref:hypothetical protein n=1 Tax=Qipengyuania sp. ASV99 TaxID=3399681 RepID=UPI003A4C6644
MQKNLESERPLMRTRSSKTALTNQITAVALDLQRFRERTDGLAYLSRREPKLKRQASELSNGPVLDVYLLEQQVARLIRVERARRRYLPGLNEDAIDWALLLDLTKAHLRDEMVYSGVLRASLTLKEPEFWRALARLENNGLVDGMYAPSDSCRIAIWLSEFGAERMMRVLAPA